jgi:acetamidase/formamidase
MAVHRFQPNVYHGTLGSHEPVLWIADGDTVKTTIVDAFGYDAQGQQVTQGANPQTGPFAIEGAEPGDTLVMHIDHLWPNRERGVSGATLAPNVVDPDVVRSLPDSGWVEWEIDRTGGKASLGTPEPNLDGLSLPLAPMLGCFGVAPPGGQAISAATAGPYGGNMDYRGFSAGVTVYFPVFVPGALLHVGDGHAVQGDGEIVGTGIEISMDVQFTVHLLKAHPIRWPRGENPAYIFTVGNARPLAQALQHATTEMHRWLTAAYRLQSRGASILLGQCVEFEVGNVYDPAYTMVCKMPKRVLADVLAT